MVSMGNTLRASLPIPEELDDLLQIICRGDTKHGAEDGIRTRDPLLGKEVGLSAVLTSIRPSAKDAQLPSGDAHGRGVVTVVVPEHSVLHTVDGW